jgi:hypothetical protein
MVVIKTNDCNKKLRTISSTPRKGVLCRQKPKQPQSETKPQRSWEGSAAFPVLPLHAVDDAAFRASPFSCSVRFL